jgi:hypothetical protein
MGACERLSTCAFFNAKMSDMPLVSQILRERHCLDDWGACARFQVSQSGRPVPVDLFPDDGDRVAQIIGPE